LSTTSRHARGSSCSSTRARSASIRTAVGDGVLSGSGRVQGRAVVAWAQDGSFKGGSLGSSGGETIARTIERAERARRPRRRLPAQRRRPAAGGRRVAPRPTPGSFRAQSLATVPMISVVSGPCAGGAAYSPTLGDFVIMTAEAVSFLTGPKIIERVTREVISAADLGGPKVQGANGVAQLVARDDVHAAELTRQLLTYLPDRVGGAGAPLTPPADAPEEDPGDVLPAGDRQVYDVRDVAARPARPRRLLRAGAALGAQHRRRLRPHRRARGRRDRQPPKHLGGCLDADAAEKGAWFVELCEPLRDPARRAQRHARLPARRQAGARRGAAPRARRCCARSGRATVPRGGRSRCGRRMVVRTSS